MLATPELMDAYTRAHPETHMVFVNCPVCGKVAADPIDIMFRLHPSCSKCGQHATEIISVIERRAA